MLYTLVKYSTLSQSESLLEGFKSSHGFTRLGSGWMSCAGHFFLRGGGEMRGFTYKGLSTCLVGAHIAVMFYHSFHDSGIGISSRSDRPVGLLRTKA